MCESGAAVRAESQLLTPVSLCLSLSQIIVTQLVNGLTELHNNQIFHRDIKIENILIETGSDVPRARLIDFGLSCFFKTQSVYRIFYGKMSAFFLFTALWHFLKASPPH